MMSFHEINEFCWSLPAIVHEIAFAILIACYSHLFFGFWLMRHRVVKNIRILLIPIFVWVFIQILYKACDPAVGIFDIYWFGFIYKYLLGLVVLNGFGVYRCKSVGEACKKVMKFNSKKK